FDAQGHYDNDTWAWNGTTAWTQLSPSAPPTARYGSAMAYDSASGQMVLFGGYNGTTYLNDTWVFDGTNWIQQNTSNSPSARTSENAIAYDAAHQQLVMFAGYNGNNDFNDTWIWGPPQNFGRINVCPAGGSGQPPCNNTMS